MAYRLWRMGKRLTLRVYVWRVKTEEWGVEQEHGGPLRQVGRKLGDT